MSATTYPYKITYLDPAGKRVSRVMVGRSSEEVRRASKIPQQRIIAVAPDYLGALDALLPKAGPPIDVQANVLSVLSAQVSSGQNASECLNRILSGYARFRSELDGVRPMNRVADKLQKLRFDPSLVLLAEVGEKSGLLGDVMSKAADEVIEKQRLINEIRKETVPALFIAVLGILTMLILPIFVAPAIKPILKARGIRITTNVCTDLMIWIGDTFASWAAWALLISAIAALAYSAPLWWPRIKKFPVFSTLEDFFQVQSSFLFLSSFLPLYSRGVSALDSLKLMNTHSRGKSKKIYAEMYAHLERGGALSLAFTSDYWHPILRDSLSGLDQMLDSEKVVLLARLRPMLSNQMTRSGRTLGATLTTVGILMAVGVTGIIFMGMMMPLLTLGTSFK